MKNEKKEKIKNLEIKKKDEKKIKLKYIKKTIEELKKETSNIKKKKINSKLRYFAKISNLEKKNDIDIKIIKKNIFINFFKEIIPIIEKVNNLSCFLKNKKKINTSISEGFFLTKKNLEKIILSWNVKTINNINEKFNPNFHILQENKNQKNISPKEIINIIKPGYIIEKQVIIKAIVKIK